MYEHFPFVLEDLPYAYNALEPYIDAKTVEVHHDKHLGTYVKNLNKALENYPMYYDWSLEKLIAQNQMLPRKIQTEVFNNAGGVYNHNFYFNMLTPERSDISRGFLMKGIEKSFFSFNDFKKEFTKAALSVFGSGYAWLLAEPNGNLKIATTPNQVTNLSVCGDGAKILTIDVWEHAYYLKYLNMRADYVNNIYNIFDWEQADRLYLDCLNQIY